MEVLIDTTGGIGQKQDLRTHFLHQTHRKYHILHRIAFIIVYPPLHHNGRYPFYLCIYKLSFVSGYRRPRKSFDALIWNGFFHCYMFCIIPQTGSEDQRQFRYKRQPLFHRLITPIQFFFTCHRRPPSAHRHPILPALHPVPVLPFLFLFSALLQILSPVLCLLFLSSLLLSLLQNPG